MGGITYNGVEGDGGNIFKDMKFWVATRIPARDNIINKIKGNGGQVVPLEKDAFLLIADHVRKDAPQNSYSWNYITDSVDNGVAQLTDRYSIWGESPGTRTGTSSAPSKSSRTPFAKADDAVLANWVLAHPSDRAGNAIYQKFAETHPRHTWQSWRSRFLKVLMPLSLEELQKMALTAADVVGQSSRPGSAKPSPRRPLVSSISPRTPVSKVNPEPASKERGSNSKKDGVVSTAPVEIPDEEGSDEEEQATDSAEEPPVAGETSDAALETRRERFYEYLTIYLEENGVEVSTQRRISGHVIDLWDLSEAVSDQQVPLEEVNWNTVAEDLEYDWDQAGAAKKGLQHCYENIIVGFLEDMSNFESIQEDDSKFAHRPSPPDVATPSPTQRNKKRSADSSSAAGPSRKRRRQKDEIPSTPEENLGKGSSSRHRRDSGTSEDEQVVFETQIHPLSRLETQLSSLDVTPSQQLRSEAMDASPIPLQLDRTAQRLNTPKEMQDQIKRRITSRRLPASFGSPAESRAKQPSYPNRVESNAPGNSQAIQDCVEYYESLGYSRDIVIKSLVRTTMTPGWPATMLMDRLKAKEGVPSNCEGIWTNRDDHKLRYADEVLSGDGDAPTEKQLRKAQRHLDRITHKHGEERVNLRRQFLLAQEDDKLSNLG